MKSGDAFYCAGHIAVCVEDSFEPKTVRLRDAEWLLEREAEADQWVFGNVGDAIEALGKWSTNAA